MLTDPLDFWAQVLGESGTARALEFSSSTTCFRSYKIVYSAQQLSAARSEVIDTQEANCWCFGSTTWGYSSSIIYGMRVPKLLVLAAVFSLTSIVSVVTGATSLITVPVMIALGSEPHIAVAMNMFALIFLSTGGLIPFWKSGMVLRRCSLIWKRRKS